MRTRRESQPPMTPWWWPMACLAAIAAWVGVTLAGAYVWPGGEAGGRYAFVAYGAMFFGSLFGYAVWFTRRSQIRARSELFERLALTPVPPDALRASTAGMYRIGYVYFAAGMIVTALGLAAVAASGSPWEGRLLRIAIGIVVIWFVYMLYALWKVTRVSDSMFAPLGLRLVSMPSYTGSVFHDIRSLEGAVSYAGHRRGRDVTIVIGIGASGTVVSGSTATTRPPTTAQQMATLTGERAWSWRNVSVTVTDGQVVVQRTGRDSGRWLLHDLLLAEAVAGRSDSA